MEKYMAVINPDEPENGRGSISIFKWNHLMNYVSDEELLRKEFCIDMQSDAESLIVEGKIWFKKHLGEIKEELEACKNAQFTFEPF